MLDEDKRGATERQGKIEVKWKLFQVKFLNFFADENLDAVTIAQTIVSKNEAQAKFNFN